MFIGQKPVNNRFCKYIQVHNTNFYLSGYNNDCAEYEITIDPQSFFDQNTGLPNQTCNHSAICVDQFLVEVHFNTLKCCIGTCARSGRPISTPNG